MRAVAFLPAILLFGVCLGCETSATRAVQFDEAAFAHKARGDLQGALERYELAAREWESAGHADLAAATWSNVAELEQRRGAFDRAEAAWRRAVRMVEPAGPSRLLYASNLGSLYLAWGQPEAALKLFRANVRTASALSDRRNLSRLLNNIGTALQHLGKPAEALTQFERALTIDRQSGREAGACAEVGVRLGNLGAVHAALGDVAKARASYEESIAIARELHLEPELATRLNNLATLELDAGRYAEARALLLEALALHKKLQERFKAATVVGNLGIADWYAGDVDEALSRLERAVALKEDLRLQATGAARRDYLASQVETYRWLTAVRAAKGDVNGALLAAELSRGRQMADQLDLDAAGALAPERVTQVVKAFQASMTEGQVLVYFANIGWNHFWRFVVTNKTLRADRRSSALEPPAAQPSGAQPSGAELQRELIRFTRLHKGTDPDPARRSARRELASALYRVLLDGAYPKAPTTLFIVTDGELGLVPFETLLDRDGRLVVERSAVAYLPSLTVAASVDSREATEGRRDLIAIGAPRYDDASEAPRRTRGPASWVAQRGLDRGGDQRPTYQALGLATWAELPGAAAELDDLQRLFPQATVWRGDDASEERLAVLSRTGDLSRYRLLHFATHGFAVAEVPELSALVLAHNSKGSEDGYLNAREAASLDLDADLVVLSACDTGAGRVVAGEGVVALSRAFMVAGARGVVVSLWPVADEATAIFMRRFYSALRDGRDPVTALAEVKRAFLLGEGDAGPFTDSARWAPFVYHGARPAINLVR